MNVVTEPQRLWRTRASPAWRRVRKVAELGWLGDRGLSCTQTPGIQTRLSAGKALAGGPRSVATVRRRVVMGGRYPNGATPKGRATQRVPQWDVRPRARCEATGGEAVPQGGRGTPRQGGLSPAILQPSQKTQPATQVWKRIPPAWGQALSPAVRGLGSSSQPAPVWTGPWVGEGQPGRVRKVKALQKHSQGGVGCWPSTGSSGLLAGATGTQGAAGHRGWGLLSGGRGQFTVALLPGEWGQGLHFHCSQRVMMPLESPTAPPENLGPGCLRRRSLQQRPRLGGGARRTPQLTDIRNLVIGHPEVCWPTTQLGKLTLRGALGRDGGLLVGNCLLSTSSTPGSGQAGSHFTPQQARAPCFPWES